MRIYSLDLLDVNIKELLVALGKIKDIVIDYQNQLVTSMIQIWLSFWCPS